jgi:hypothetical protein
MATCEYRAALARRLLPCRCCSPYNAQNSSSATWGDTTLCGVCDGTLWVRGMRGAQAKRATPVVHPEAAVGYAAGMLGIRATAVPREQRRRRQRNRCCASAADVAAAAAGERTSRREKNAPTQTNPAASRASNEAHDAPPPRSGAGRSVSRARRRRAT